MDVTITELAQRQRATLPLFELASRIIEMEVQGVDLRLEIAEAEDRGDWRRAAELRAVSPGGAPSARTPCGVSSNR